MGSRKPIGFRQWVVHIGNIDVSKLVEALDKCKGAVYLITDEDCFNLRGKLSQIVGLLSLIEGGKLTRARIMADDPEDESMLFRMNLFLE